MHKILFYSKFIIKIIIKIKLALVTLAYWMRRRQRAIYAFGAVLVLDGHSRDACV